MKVRCVAAFPSEDQIARMGPAFSRHQDFHLTVGREYTVLGLEFNLEAKLAGTGVWLNIVSDFGHLGMAPLVLFEIVDPRASRYWEARAWDDGTLSLRPPSLYRDYYYDDLSEGLPEVVADFHRVADLIEREYSSPNTEVDAGG